MIESQQNREIVLRQLALAWEEGFAAALKDVMASGYQRLSRTDNPYREEIAVE